eukprot:GFUD01016373.1.p1 GENE.GFUD01016373.1~~GFUD01016373.1.p1  ORF type:complete len:616 (+),score=177.51 GFUD01016373.1:77-1924(+)
MERLRKSFRRKKNKNKESENEFEIQSVFAEVDAAAPEEPPEKPPTRLQKIRNSMRINKKKKEKEDVIEIDKETTSSEDKDFPKEEIDSIPLEKTSKLRKSLRITKKDKTEKKEKKEKKDKKKGSSKWETDDERVRSNHCEFKVKYLGNMEVQESRGMEVCESAIKTLKSSKEKKIKGTLHVSGDGLRVVDNKKKGMLVDQVIEKVSFCAPDRHYSRGFAYISRDGTSRRWVCHGFMARKDTGERLSHAVGVAFAVCLEKKQSRECEGVTGSYNEEEGTFTRFGSFRQGTLTERLQNPQEFKESATKVEVGVVENPFAIARPRPGDLRASMRGLGEIKGASPFKRGGQEYSSLRVNELPSNISRKEKSRVSLILEETFENEETKNEINEMILQMRQAELAQAAVPENVPSAASSEASFADISTLILTPMSTSKAASTKTTSPTVLTSKPPAAPASQSNATNTKFQMNNNDTGFKALVQNGSTPDLPNKIPPSPEGDNPWDLVPDQPKIKIHSRSNSKTENYKAEPNLPPTRPPPPNIQPTANPADSWLASLTNKISTVEENHVKSWEENPKKVEAWNNTNGNLEDPLEIEWAALANRNVVKAAPNGNNTNPFRAFV